MKKILIIVAIGAFILYNLPETGVVKYKKNVDTKVASYLSHKRNLLKTEK